jgi:hypothetical protein
LFLCKFAGTIEKPNFILRRAHSIPCWRRRERLSKVGFGIIERGWKFHPAPTASGEGSFFFLTDVMNFPFWWESRDRPVSSPETAV